MGREKLSYLCGRTKSLFHTIMYQKKKKKEKGNFRWTRDFEKAKQNTKNIYDLVWQDSRGQVAQC